MCEITDDNCSTNLCRQICKGIKRRDNKICKKICGDDERCQTLCDDDDKCHKLCEDDDMRIKLGVDMLEKLCKDVMKMKLTDCLCKKGECKKNCKL